MADVVTENAVVVRVRNETTTKKQGVGGEAAVDSAWGDAKSKYCVLVVTKPLISEAPLEICAGPENTGSQLKLPNANISYAKEGDLMTVTFNVQSDGKREPSKVQNETLWKEAAQRKAALQK